MAEAAEWKEAGEALASLLVGSWGSRSMERRRKDPLAPPESAVRSRQGMSMEMGNEIAEALAVREKHRSARKGMPFPS